MKLQTATQKQKQQKKIPVDVSFNKHDMKIWTFCWERQTNRPQSVSLQCRWISHDRNCATLEEMRPIKSLKKFVVHRPQGFLSHMTSIVSGFQHRPRSPHLQQSGSIYYYHFFFLFSRFLFCLTLHVPLRSIYYHLSFLFEKAQRTTLRNGWRPITWHSQLWNRWWKNPSILPATDRN